MKIVIRGIQDPSGLNKLYKLILNGLKKSKRVDKVLTYEEAREKKVSKKDYIFNM